MINLGKRRPSILEIDDTEKFVNLYNRQRICCGEKTKIQIMDGNVRERRLSTG